MIAGDDDCPKTNSLQKKQITENQTAQVEVPPKK
jgi:hypothetical protein